MTAVIVAHPSWDLCSCHRGVAYRIAGDGRRFICQWCLAEEPRGHISTAITVLSIGFEDMKESA